MDWCVDTRVPGASDRAESEIAAHLARHAVEPGAVELGRAVVHRALAGAEPGPVWATVDWTAQQSVLRLRPLPLDAPAGTEVGPGLTRAHEEAGRLAAAWRDADSTGPEQLIQLGVARIPERDIDRPAPAPASIPDLGPAHLIGLISGEIDAGHTLEEAAARAGATVASAWAGEAGAERGPADVARTLVDAEESLGADFEVVEQQGRRVMVRNRRCPFGPATGRSMCRFTSALAGGLAARDSGQADVTILESLAAGDHECRLVIDTEDRLDRAVSHRYGWPPSNSDEVPPDPPTGSRIFQVTLSLQLPRDRLSVPITRHLIRAAMDEIGVVSDDADAVDLAVTEACANVIDHSGPGDAYEVAVSMSTSACHIRVVDVGRGFDHHALALSGMADQDAEHGRGLALMRALVDQVRFESEPERGTVVHLVKRLSFEESAVAHRLMGDGEG